MKRYARILIVIALLATISSTLIYAYGRRVTRCDLFVSVAEKLGLEEEELIENPFPDYDGSIGLINALINRGWVLGRTDGTLSLDEELSFEDLIEFFARVEWPSHEVEVTKVEYVGVPYTVEVPVQVTAPTPHYAQLECPEHQFKFNTATGHYECVFCGYADPVLAFYTSPALSNLVGCTKEELEQDMLDYPGDWKSTTISGITLIKDTGSFKINSTYAVYDISSDARIYDGSDAIDYVKFFQKYAPIYSTCSAIMNYHKDAYSGMIDAIIISQ